MQGVMQEESAGVWSLGDVVYATYLVLVALAWVVLPMVLAVAGR
jgi:hypothetical protein